MGRLFETDGLDLDFFMGKFCLDRRTFLAEIKKQEAIITGVDLVLFLSGEWKSIYEAGPRALECVVLCCGAGARRGLRKALVREQPYRRVESGCRHELGEWSVVPGDKVDCYVCGRLGERKIHVVELPCAPEQAVLSRSYGSMAGTYLKGSGEMVCLFPRLTFEQRCCWFPWWPSGRRVRLVERLYRGWSCETTGTGVAVEEEEVGASFRDVRDGLCWKIRFGDGGRVEESEGPRVGGCVVTLILCFRVSVADWCCSVVGEVSEGDVGELNSTGAATGEEWARIFPTLKAQKNVYGTKYTPEAWMWNVAVGETRKGKEVDRFREGESV